jgi:hypothetical protein
MKFTWYPRNLLIAVALLLAFAAALNTAVDFERGAVAGVLGLIVYICTDVVLTVNPAQWWRQSVRNTSVASDRH